MLHVFRYGLKFSGEYVIIIVKIFGGSIYAYIFYQKRERSSNINVIVERIKNKKGLIYLVKFAVCDDDWNMVDYISNKLREYYAEECEIKKYEDGECLLADSCQEHFDALFLDIGMYGLDGMELAGKIRENNQYVKIVFVTNKEELAYKGYIYGAFRYVRKSKLDQDLCEAAESLKKYFDSLNNYLNLKTPTGEITRDIRSIKFFEVYGHIVTIVCEDAQIQVCGTMKEFDEYLNKKGFIRIHKSYLVNFRYINSVEKNDVTLTCGKKLPLSRNRADEVRKRLGEFSRGIQIDDKINTCV